MSDKALILEPKEFKQIFSEKKREILNYLHLNNYDSISELAEDLERNKSIVSRDLSKLENVGIVELVEEDGKKCPVLVESEIRVDRFDVSSLFPLPGKSEPELYNQELIDNKEGVLYGEYCGDGVFLDRWSLEQGYNQITTGKIGSGKSYSNKLNMIRSYCDEDDLKIIMVDPVGVFDLVNRVLGGKKIKLGDSEEINPMRISETHTSMLTKSDYIKPYNVKVSSIMDSLNILFSKRNIQLDDQSKNVLKMAIEETYNDFGISRDVQTHSKQSPTLRDLVKKVDNIINNPTDYTDSDNKNHINNIQKNASTLLLLLEKFKTEEEYGYVSSSSSFDLSDNDIAYFDLSQHEGSSDVGFLMNLILSEVFEEAKRTDKKVMLYLDEAHYLIDNTESLGFLNKVTERSKDIDLSINFITQTINEFFKNEETIDIVENFPIRMLHRNETDLYEETKEILNLDESHTEYIKNAHPGSKERGYSEALLGVSGKGYLPIRVSSSEEEDEILSLYDNRTWKSILEK